MNHARQFVHDAPRWRVACQIAFLEADRTRLPERIAEARMAIFDRAEEMLTQPSSPEHRALNNALHTLRALEEQIIKEKPAA